MRFRLSTNIIEHRGYINIETKKKLLTIPLLTDSNGNFTGYTKKIEESDLKYLKEMIDDVLEQVENKIK